MLVELDEAIVLLKHGTTHREIIWHRSRCAINSGHCLQEIRPAFVTVHHTRGAPVWFNKVIIGLRGPTRTPCVAIVDLGNRWCYYDAVGENEKMIRNFYSFICVRVVKAKKCENCRPKTKHYRKNEWV